MQEINRGNIITLQKERGKGIAPEIINLVLTLKN